MTCDTVIAKLKLIVFQCIDASDGIDELNL